MTSWATYGLFTAVLILCYAWMRHQYAYWQRRGVEFQKPLPLFGNLLAAFLQKESYRTIILKWYLQLKSHKVFGIFGFLTPSLIICDPDLIKEVTVKYFDHFNDRAIQCKNTADFLVHKSLFNLRGQDWKDMRNLISPAFTSSKLRAMFPMIAKCGEQLSNFLLSRTDSQNSPIDFKCLLTRHTTDVIASVNFGVKTDAVNNPEEEFYQLGHKLTDFTGWILIKIAASFFMPRVLSIFNITILPPKNVSYFCQIIYGTKKYRLENNTSRPDMLQLFMAAQSGGIKTEPEDDQIDSVGEGTDSALYHRKHLAKEKICKREITDEDIAAQAMLFYFGAYDVLSNVLSFMAYELALHSDIQERLTQEIESTISENDGKLTYDAVLNMKYLDMVVSEVLRKYPVAAMVDRRCTKHFKLPESNIVIEKNTPIIIPIYCLHYDPEYFQNANHFDPERFSEENKKNIRPYTYIPFGSGPHNCIGIRMALLEVKMCAVFLLTASELQISSKTQVPIEISKSKFQITTDTGIWLLCKNRDNPISFTF